MAYCSLTVKSFKGPKFYMDIQKSIIVLLVFYNNCILIDFDILPSIFINKNYFENELLKTSRNIKLNIRDLIFFQKYMCLFIRRHVLKGKAWGDMKSFFNSEKLFNTILIVPILNMKTYVSFFFYFFRFNVNFVNFSCKYKLEVSYQNKKCLLGFILPLNNPN